MPVAPLVTVLLAVHDGERYLGAAVASALGQTSSDLELLVVDDASTDRTSEILAEVAEARLRVIRNDERLGLAGSLNRGLDEARGEYIARLDADDVALPRRLEHQLARLRSSPRVGVLGSAVLEIDDSNRVGRLHQMPTGASAVRWAALFSSPFFHPSVFVDRDLLERNGLRYDTSFEESEDYELWSRLLDVAEGDNLPDPLVLYRVHAAQASQRRRELQRECQLRVARRRIADARARALGRRGRAGVACRQRRRDRSRRVRSSCRRVSRPACRLRATSTGQAPAHRLPVMSRAWRRMRLRDRVRV